jgi:hypothetical protein
MPRVALAAIGIPPSGPPGAPGPIAGVAPRPLVPGNAGATWLNAGAAEAQLCGTESVPIEAARPTPAVTSALPIPGAPKTPVPEPKPLPTANPNARNWLPKTLAVGPTGRMSAPAEPNIEMPDVDIDAPEPIPDARPVPDVSAVDDDVRVVNDDSGDIDDVDDIDEAVAARPVLGTAAVNGVDIAVVSGATV